MQTKKRTVGTRLPSSLIPSLYGILTLFLLGGLIGCASAAAEAIRNALSLCIGTVIPAVFPMMVMAGLLSDGEGGRIISRWLGRPVAALFGVSSEAVTPILLGFLCGFPAGAMAAAKAYRSGRISKRAISRLMTFINNPGPVFVIFAIGKGQLGSAAIGTVIWLSVLLSALTVGVATRFLMPDGKDIVTSYSQKKLTASHITVSAISSAARGAVNVCAYTSFFSAAVGVLSPVLSRLGIPHQMNAAVYAFLELIGGCSAISGLSDLRFAIPAIAAACSWSGISVQMQIASVCDDLSEDSSLSLTPMVLSKLCQAVFSPLIASLIATSLGLI